MAETCDLSPDWDSVLKAKGLEVPMSAEGQYLLAVSVACPWHLCLAAEGQRCKPSLVFPQYPHTSRLMKAAMEAKER